jgi:hypothetical protein
MRPFSDADDPRLPFDDPTQQRYEVIRPLTVRPFFSEFPKFQYIE